MEVPQSHLLGWCAQATRDAKLSSRSRGAGGVRGEEVLDRRELPDTLGCPRRAVIVELILVRLTILGVSFGRPKTYVALRRQTRKLPGESRMLRGGAGEIHQLFSERIVKRTPAAGTQGRALLARIQVAQCRSLRIGDWAHTQESRAFCFFHFVHLAAIV